MSEARSIEPVAGRLDTFPRLLMQHARLRGERPATREKDLGIWQTWTWAPVYSEARALASALAQMGFKRGENLAIIGDNRPRLYWSFAAAQMLGGIPVPLYQDAVATEMAFVLQDAEIRFAIVEDQEQVDKMLEIVDQCPALKHIFYDDPRGLRHYHQMELTSLYELIETGRAHDRPTQRPDARPLAACVVRRDHRAVRRPDVVVTTHGLE